ncbi:4Fe-4S dicluster domain-containing protein [Desulfitobacterium sp.]|uniref:4Fe-4S dicluster domain-containing protein n=1 Tax=Desulfitobacterium sp. TaxID=49981 RepID=UPI002B1FF618|nr:4Fe-4S dicluster domain-containing protein [Desulfitobacterium sp.]MEA4901580.1 4Fe-4S dicluster domain-containing protein [Desulfitobacterium sp.]
MEKVIVVNQDLCNGCQLCQMGCHLRKNDRSGLRSSRIQVFHLSGSENLVQTCNHCEEPICKTACLMEAISKTKKGLTERNESACIGCEACIAMCPFGAAVLDTDREVAVSCDLCSGNPYCVTICPTGALQFIEPQVEGLSKRQLAAERMAMAGRNKVYQLP